MAMRTLVLAARLLDERGKFLTYFAYPTHYFLQFAGKILYLAVGQPDRSDRADRGFILKFYISSGGISCSGMQCKVSLQ